MSDSDYTLYRRYSVHIGLGFETPPRSAYDGARHFESDEHGGEDEDGDADPAAGRIRGLQERDVDLDGGIAPDNVNAVAGLHADVGQKEPDARHDGLEEEVGEELDELPAKVPTSARGNERPGSASKVQKPCGSRCVWVYKREMTMKMRPSIKTANMTRFTG